MVDSMAQLLAEQLDEKTVVLSAVSLVVKMVDWMVELKVAMRVV